LLAFFEIQTSCDSRLIRPASLLQQARIMLALKANRIFIAWSKDGLTQDENSNTLICHMRLVSRGLLWVHQDWMGGRQKWKQRQNWRLN
jgi:hypothetical protein